MALENLTTVGILLIFAGLFILIVSILLQGKGQKTESGSVIFIGPFPLAFGSLKSTESMKVLQFAGFILVIAYAVWLLYLKR